MPQDPTRDLLLGQIHGFLGGVTVIITVDCKWRLDGNSIGQFDD